jgi:hypothetical protein
MVLWETLADELASEDTEPPRGRKDEREVEALALEITEFRPEWEEELSKTGEGSMEPEINCEVDQKVISSPKSRGGIWGQFTERTEDRHRLAMLLIVIRDDVSAEDCR